MPFIVDNYMRQVLCVDVPMSGDFATELLHIETFDRGSIQAVWTGADATSARVIPEASVTGDNWCALFPLAATLRVDDVDGCLLYTLPSMEYPFLRVRFERQSNTTGSITIHTFCKRNRPNNP